LSENRKLQIALDARLADYTSGGIARYSIELARALAALELPEGLTVLRSARPQVSGERLDGVRSVRLFTPPHFRWEQLTLPIELLRLRPDLLHSTDFIPPGRRNFRSVITVHDLAFLRFPETLTAESRGYYGQIWQAVKSADRIIAVSEATRRDLLELVRADERKIEVVAEAASGAFKPIESAAELAAVRRRLGVEREFVLFVGSFEPRKNLVTLLEAIAQLRRGLDIQLVLVGKRGWLYEPIFARMAALGLEPHARVIDDLPQRLLPAAYSAAGALALPSLYEGFGLTVLEAMACGCPVVSSDRPALPETVGEAGLQVPADDHQALAEALGRVLTDVGLRTELRRRGLARAQEFSWERAARETASVYRRALA
jgi:glycosyltransferase involved in cell wall biosynthesis